MVGDSFYHRLFNSPLMFGVVPMHEGFGPFFERYLRFVSKKFPRLADVRITCSDFTSPCSLMKDRRFRSSHLQEQRREFVYRRWYSGPNVERMPNCPF